MDEFERLYQDCAITVYRFLLSLCGDASLAEELTGETFYRAWLHIGQFRGDCKPETWLCAIARNALHKEMRRRHRYVPWEQAENVAHSADMADVLADREQACAIYSLARSLSEPYREVFLLRALGGMTFREVGVALGHTENWAKVTYYRAKSKLIEKMEDQDET